MKNEKHIQEEVDKTLRVLDTAVNLDSNPFLMTRIESAMAASVVEETVPFALRSAMMQLALVFILLCNIVTVVSYYTSHANGDMNESLTAALRNDYQIVLYQDETNIGN